MIAIAVWFVALVVPSANFLVFDGLPLSSVAELAVLVLGAVMLCSTRCRVVARNVLGWRGGRGLAAVIAIGAIVVAAKLVLLVGAPLVGFEACYSNPVAPRPGGGCELSFENLASRTDATRVDETIDFGPRVPAAGDSRLISGSNWNLSFVNDSRLHIYPWVRGNLNVERLPFRARWRGEIAVRRAGVIPVRYIGQGTVRAGGESARLAPAYGSERTVFVPVRPGRQQLRISYAFADRYRTDEGEPRGPYATLRVGAVQPDRRAEAEGPLYAVGPGRGWTVLAVAVDAAFVLLGLALVAVIVSAARRSRAFIVVAVLVGFAAWVLADERWGFGPAAVPIAPTVLAFLVVVLLLAYRRVEDLLLLGIPAAILLAAERVLASPAAFTWSIPDVHAVLFRTRGDDWLTYQSFARAILEHGSLQGGENVFYFQPGFRYWAFASHALSGDGDAFPAIAGLALFLTAVLCATRWSVGRARRGRALPRGDGQLVVGIALVALIVLGTSPPIVGHIQVGLSEFATWIMIPVILLLLFTRSTWPRWIAGSAMLAGIAVVRPNQGIAAVFLMAVFVVWQLRREPRRVAVCTAVFVGVLLLPALHNLWYGGELVLLSTNASTARDLPLERLVDVFSDGAVRSVLRDKASGLAYLTPRFERDTALGLAILTLQVAWLTTLVRAISRRAAVPWHCWCLLAWPLTFAIPYISYDVFNYYPRHLIAMYVSAGVAVIFVQARYLASERINCLNRPVLRTGRSPNAPRDGHEGTRAEETQSTSCQGSGS